MLSKSTIEAYYIKLIGVTLVMTATCVSDAGARQLTYEDIFRLVEGQEIVLADDAENSDILSGRPYYISFSQTEDEQSDFSIIAQIAHSLQQEERLSFLYNEHTHMHAWKACVLVERDQIDIDGLTNTVQVSCYLPINEVNVSVSCFTSLFSVFAGSMSESRAGPVSRLS